MMMVNDDDDWNNDDWNNELIGRFVMLSQTEKQPFFYNEQFDEYGLNRASFTEKLKYQIDHFYMITHAFLIDLPHKE